MNTSDIEGHLRRRFESSLESRVRRTQELQYRRIIGSHYFAAASTQCLELFRDGYMLGCIMCSQALLQAMLKFVAKRNKLEFKKSVEDLLIDLELKDLLNAPVIAASKLAWQHRNDFHHLESGISKIELEAKARQCVEAIVALENEIFDASFEAGAIVPRNSIYWNVRADGTVPVFLRQLDI